MDNKAMTTSPDTEAAMRHVSIERHMDEIDGTEPAWQWLQEFQVQAHDSGALSATIQDHRDKDFKICSLWVDNRLRAFFAQWRDISNFSVLVRCDLATQAPPSGGGEMTQPKFQSEHGPWKCYHCDLLMCTHEEAIEHFGARYDYERPKCASVSAIKTSFDVIRSLESELRTQQPAKSAVEKTGLLEAATYLMKWFPEAPIPATEALAALIERVQAGRTPGTIEVCEKCRASSDMWIRSEFRQPVHIERCAEPVCPIRAKAAP